MKAEYDSEGDTIQIELEAPVERLDYGEDVTMAPSSLAFATIGR